MAKPYRRKLLTTGRWIFVSNTAVWSADRFLEDGGTELYYAVSRHHRVDIAAGDRGLLRLNNDQRTADQRQGRPKIEAGIYAQIEVIGAPRLMPDPVNAYYVKPADQLRERWRVPIRIVESYIERPLHVRDLPDNPALQYLKRPLQTATIPIAKEAYEQVVGLLVAASRGDTRLEPLLTLLSGEEPITAFSKQHVSTKDNDYLYGSRRTWEIVFETVKALGRPVSHAEVSQRIARELPDFALTNVRADLSMLSVNCPLRGHYYMNRLARRSDTGSQYDLLIRLGSGRDVRFVPYDASVHGTWQLLDLGGSILEPELVQTADAAELERARDYQAMACLTQV